MTHYGVGDVARKLNVHPKVLTQMFYRGALDAARCPIVCGRRLIPEDILPDIAAKLAARS
jgi:hypothetical protein